MKGLLIALAAAAALATVIHTYSLEGLDGLLFARTVHEDTVYAAGYSDAAFRKIDRGAADPVSCRRTPVAK